MPTTGMPTTGGHRVAVLALPGVLALDIGIPVQAFGDDPRYQVTVCATFHHHLGTSPRKYRALFAHQPAPAQAAEPA